MIQAALALLGFVALMLFIGALIRKESVQRHQRQMNRIRKFGRRHSR